MRIKSRYLDLLFDKVRLIQKDKATNLSLK